MASLSEAAGRRTLNCSWSRKTFVFRAKLDLGRALPTFPSMPKTTCVILNPSAGSVEDLDDLTARLARLPDTEIRVTSKRGSAARFARTAIKKGRQTIVAAGGDGTLNEVINGIGENLGEARVGL